MLLGLAIQNNVSFEDINFPRNAWSYVKQGCEYMISAMIKYIPSH